MEDEELKKRVYSVFSDRTMILLAFVAIPVIIAQYLVLPTTVSFVVTLLDWLIYLAFLLEFVLKVMLEQDRMDYIGKNTLDSAISVVIIAAPIVDIIFHLVFVTPAPLRLLSISKIVRVGAYTSKGLVKGAELKAAEHMARESEPVKMTRHGPY